MFTNLRKSAQSLFAKLILFMLVAMFALWGIGDVFRGMGAGPSSVASVGKTQISMQEYQIALKHSQGNQQQALSGLINNLLIRKEEDAMGIVVGDDAVADFIAGLPQLKGKDGKFDKSLYEAMIAGSGKSEQAIAEDVRREIAARLLLEPFTNDAQVPGEMLQLFYKVHEEQRTASLLLLDPSSVAQKLQPPGAQEIKAYYDAHPKEFFAPEYRTLSYVTLPLADVQAKTEASEDEIKQVYADRKDDFRAPERHQIEEMQFDNEQDAKDATKKLSQGKSFAQVAKAAPVSNEGKTSLGMVAKQDLPPEVADQVFGLKQDGVTTPIFAGFRWHIYHVSKIEADHPQTFEEAHADIAREIAGKQAQETIVRMINGFEDALAGGATLEQAAEKIGQKVHTLPAIAQDGATPDGKKIELPKYDNFLSVAFATAEKDHSQAAQASDGSYFLVRVDSVAPGHTRPLEEVKEQVAKAAMAEKVKTKLEKTAQALSQQLRAGKKPAEALASLGIDIAAASSGKLRRDSDVVPEGTLKGKPLPPALCSELFRLRPGGSTHAYPLAGGGYMVASLSDIIPAPANIDAKVMQTIKGELKETLSDEISHQYLTYLRGKYPVSVNAAALGMKDEGGGE